LLLPSEDIAGGAEDDVAMVVGEREPFSSVGIDDLGTLPFSKLKSLVEGDSSTV